MSTEYWSFWKRVHKQDAGEAELERSESEASPASPPAAGGEVAIDTVPVSPLPASEVGPGRPCDPCRIH